MADAVKDAVVADGVTDLVTGATVLVALAEDEAVASVVAAQEAFNFEL